MYTRDLEFHMGTDVFRAPWQVTLPFLQDRWEAVQAALAAAGEDGGFGHPALFEPYWRSEFRAALAAR